MQEKGNARNSSISQEKEGIADMSRQQSPATLDEKAQQAVAAQPNLSSESAQPASTPVKPVSFFELFRCVTCLVEHSPS